MSKSERLLAAVSNAPIARLRLAAFIVPAVVIFGFVVQMGLDLQRHRHLAIATAEREAMNLARALEEHAARVVGETDAALLSVIEAVAGAGLADGRIDTQVARGSILERKSTRNWLDSILILDRDGNAVVQELMAGEAQAFNSADRAYFKTLSAHPEIGLFFDAPFRSRVTGKLVIPAARAIQGPDGSFQGTVRAAFDPAYFGEFYRGLRIGRDSAIALYRSDGIMLTREPFRSRPTPPSARGSAAAPPAW
jgi:hypothetical protein